MTTLTWPNPKLMMSQHLEVLQGYANRAVLKQENLTLSETEDRVRRIRQFFGIGHSFGVTEKELVHLLFKNVFIARKGCECPVCRVRETKQSQDDLIHASQASKSLTTEGA